jgi:hypothetical protein
MRSVTVQAAAWMCVLLIGSAIAADPQPSRYALEAELVPTAAAVGEGRFRLQATLQPQPSRPTAADGSWSLKATLAPASEPICYGPGSVFANGFEPD